MAMDAVHMYVLLLQAELLLTLEEVAKGTTKVSQRPAGSLHDWEHGSLITVCLQHAMLST
jgi:hypothetical protein